MIASNHTVHPGPQRPALVPRFAWVSLLLTWALWSCVPLWDLQPHCTAWRAVVQQGGQHSRPWAWHGVLAQGSPRAVGTRVDAWPVSAASFPSVPGLPRTFKNGPCLVPTLRNRNVCSCLQVAERCCLKHGRAWPASVSSLSQAGQASHTVTR